MKDPYTKAVLLFVILSVAASFVFAQKSQDNIIKMNLPALVFKNFSFQYERAVNKKQSFCLAVRYRPTGSLSFQNAIEKIIDDTSYQVNLAKIGNIGITPEYRFYLGKKGVFRGLYIGPFISYNHYTGDVPINYDDYDASIPANVERLALFKGSMNTFTAGLQLGSQLKLGDKLYLDWWIVGPNYGFCRGSFAAAGPISDNGQIALEIRLKELIRPSLPLDIMKDIQVNANSASFKTNGPWLGVRAFGINLGYRF